MAEKKPLCVDLDGTLVFTDTMFESFFALLKEDASVAFRVWFWLLLGGRTSAKQGVAQRIQVPVERLPYNEDLLKWLRAEKASGRTLCLVTGSSQLYAQAVADHIPIFDEVFGTTIEHNMAGPGKAHTLVKQFGNKGFAYAGNASADLHVWKHASEIIVVNAHPSLVTRAKKIGPIAREFGTRRISASVVLRAVRWHQWAKNLLIFVPLLTAHQLSSTNDIVAASMAFLAFCAIASAIYLMNDLVDINTDRLNQYKKTRPIASGALPILTALKLGLLLGFISLGISLLLPLPFLLVVFLYACINIAYSLALKRIIVADVLIIASLYVLRIFAGSAATGIVTSPWLFAFAALVFLSLALVKRISEISNVAQANQTKVVGRGYKTSHRKPLLLVGQFASYASLAVLFLYIQSPTVQILYRKPFFLWLLIPLFGLWLLRVWRMTKAGKMHEDPTVFATKDLPSYGTALAALLVVFLAT